MKDQTTETQARFTNRPFRCEMGRTPAGSIRITFRLAAKDSGSERQLSACIYEVAAELERRCESVSVRWAVSPAAYDRRLDLELGERDNADLAAQLVTGVLQEAGLL